MLSQEFRSSRMGSSLRIKGGIDPATGQPPQERGILLEASLSDIPEEDRYVPGSWVLMLAAREIERQRFDPDLPQPAQVTPLKATIHLAAGGATNFVEVSAAPGAVLQLPAAFVRVVLEWDSLPAAAGIEEPWAIPLLVDVVGTLQRGTARSRARRSFLLNRRATGPIVSSGRVPPLARSVAVYGDLTDGPFAADSALILLESENTPLITLTGLELLALIKDGSRLDVPGSATLYRFTSERLETTARVDFEIEL